PAAGVNGTAVRQVVVGEGDEAVGDLGESTGPLIRREALNAREWRHLLLCERAATVGGGVHVPAHVDLHGGAQPGRVVNAHDLHLGADGPAHRHLPVVAE